MLWKRLGNSVGTATCFDEAMAALVRGRRLSFAESQHDRGALALEVRRLRPDLCDAYASPQQEHAAARHVVEMSEVDAAERFEEAITATLRDLPLSDQASPAVRARVAKDLLATRFKGLAPQYGTRGK